MAIQGDAAGTPDLPLELALLSEERPAFRRIASHDLDHQTTMPFEKKRRVINLTEHFAHLMSAAVESEEALKRFIVTDLLTLQGTSEEGIKHLLHECERFLSDHPPLLESFHRALKNFALEHPKSSQAFPIFSYYASKRLFTSEELYALAKISIASDDQPLFHILIDPLYPDIRVANQLTHQIVENNFCPSYEDLEHLFTVATSELDDFEKERIVLDCIERLFEIPLKLNLNLLKFFILYPLEDLDSSTRLDDAIQTLIQQQRFVEAQHLLEIVASEIPKQSQKGIGASVKALGEQVGYLADYLKWSVFSYQQERFPDLSETHLQQIFSEDQFAKLKDLLQVSFLSRLAEIRGSSHDELKLKKMIEKGIPLSFKTQPDFLNFLTRSDILSSVNYYHHDWITDTHNQPQLLVDGTYISGQEVLRRFELKEKSLGPKKIEIIVEKETGRQYCYLANGLVPHDPETDLTHCEEVQGDGNCYLKVLCLDHGNTTTPVGIKRLLQSHSWVCLQDAAGKIFSFGKWGNGKVACPDYYQLKLLPKCVNKLQITAEEFRSVITAVQAQMAQAAPAFDLLIQNCSCFSSSILSTIERARASAATDFSFLNSLETRIKFYNAALQIKEELFSKRDVLLPQIRALHSFLEVAHTGTLHVAADGAAFITNYQQTIDLLQSIVSSANGFCLQNELLILLGMLKQIDDPAMIQNFSHLFRNILNGIQFHLSSGNQGALVNNLYNLFEDLARTIGPRSINHPFALFENIKRLPGIASYQSKTT